jgi:2-iminobutanoate/2-iminopropanoate deaminase
MTHSHDPVDVPVAIGGYTNAMEVGPGQRLLFISGQIPETPAGVVPEGAEEQCRLIWQHIVACLRSAGMGISDLVKVTTFLSSRDNAPVNTTVRREVLGEHRPALTVIVAEIFDSKWKLEIEAVAAGARARDMNGAAVEFLVASGLTGTT